MHARAGVNFPKTLRLSAIRMRAATLRVLLSVAAGASVTACVVSAHNTSATTSAPASPSMSSTMPMSGSPMVHAASDSAAGQYLTVVGGCNDCHTVGWAESNGRTVPSQQLTGNPVGYRGPWGTTYAANLRTVAQRATEDRWVQILKTADGGRGRPPMPWMNTMQMNEQDLRALYRYIHSLGAAGSPTPRAVAPGVAPTTPYINFVPVQPGSGQ